VRPSSIEGLGLFAARHFHTGERIRRIDESRVVDRDHPLRPEAGEFEYHLLPVPGAPVLLPAPERHLNHSCDPNAWLHWDGDGCYLVARRYISSGEEVTLDYRLFSLDGDAWACNCSAVRCPGVVNGGITSLTPALLEEYRPLLPPWLAEWLAIRPN
jgi:hypothetical protein